tara:strand:- start:4460 stop:5161 length:702 start_codon:yes stop_codon:yes gene_type:complete
MQQVSKEQEILKELVKVTSDFIISDDKRQWEKLELKFNGGTASNLRKYNFKKTPIIFDYLVYGFLMLSKILKDDEDVSNINKITLTKNESEIILNLTAETKGIVQMLMANTTISGENSEQIKVFEVIETIIESGNGSGSSESESVSGNNVSLNISSGSIKISYGKETAAEKQRLTNLRNNLKTLIKMEDKDNNYFTYDNLIKIGVICFHRDKIDGGINVIYPTKEGGSIIKEK